MKVIEDLIPKGRKNRPGRKNPMQYITLHETGNTAKGADARAHAKYLKSDAAVNAQVSWHYSVDDTCAVRHIPDNEDAWHAGEKTGNRTSIGVEICVNQDGNFTAAVENAVALCANLCRTHGIRPENIVEHHHWSGKNCPERLRKGIPYSFETFVGKVKASLACEVSAWAKPAWEELCRRGVVDGTRPYDPATREEVAVMLMRFCKCD